MEFDQVVALCRTFPGVTEDVKWGDHLCFLVGGKIFAILSLAPGSAHLISLKAGHPAFETLTVIDGVVPAPYLARGGWVSLTRWDALGADRLAAVLREAYEIVRAGLPRRVRDELEGTGSARPARRTTKSRGPVSASRARSGSRVRGGR